MLPRQRPRRDGEQGDRRSVRRHNGTGKVRYRVLDSGTRVSSEPPPHAVASATRWELVTDDPGTLGAIDSVVLAVDEIVHRVSRTNRARVWRIRVNRFDNGKLRVKMESSGPARIRITAEGFEPIEVLLCDAATRSLATPSSSNQSEAFTSGIDLLP